MCFCSVALFPGGPRATRARSGNPRSRPRLMSAPAMSAISLGYIHTPRTDGLWFIALPFIAVAIALFFHSALPYVAQASIAVWITVPHHYAGWVRGYGLAEDWSRWRTRLIVGPLLLIPTVLFGSAFVPITMALVLMLWDHQHSMMQQYGFARIYDFKAGAGAQRTGRWDFWLGILLYSNMLLTAPLWAELWIAELYRWDLALTAPTIRAVQSTSYTLTGLYLVAYAVHVGRSIAAGHRVNPMKYAFVFSSYALWYYVSWQDSYLVYLVAHRIMHGLQYMAMVYWYVEKKEEVTGAVPRGIGSLNVMRFIFFGALYAIVFHLAIGGGVEEMSFGLVSALQSDGALDFTAEQATGFYAATAVSAASVCHYYLDSYIWKIRESRTQEGL